MYELSLMVILEERFIKGLNLESEISDIVNYNSTYASNLLEKEKLREICQKRN